MKVGDGSGFRDGLTRGVGGGSSEVTVDHGDVVGFGVVLVVVVGFRLRLGGLFGFLGGGGGRARGFELGSSVEQFGNGEVVGGIELEGEEGRRLQSQDGLMKGSSRSEAPLLEAEQRGGGRRSKVKGRKGKKRARADLVLLRLLAPLLELLLGSRLVLLVLHVFVVMLKEKRDQIYQRSARNEDEEG